MLKNTKFRNKQNEKISQSERDHSVTIHDMLKKSLNKSWKMAGIKTDQSLNWNDFKQITLCAIQLWHASGNLHYAPYNAREQIVESLILSKCDYRNVFLQRTSQINKRDNFLPPDKHATCACQGIRNVSFSEDFANVRNGWSPEKCEKY